MTSSGSDADLVWRVRQRDKRAFVAIVARYQGTVCGIALGILADFAESEDAAQEAFLTAWRKMDTLREPERLRSWLCRIARNAALAQLRRRRGGHEELESASGVADESPLPDEGTATREEAALVREALSKLPEQYRLPLVLYYREGQSVRMVAETLELTEDAVKQRLVRGREMLRERITGTIERVLTQSCPGPVFTMTVAAAIGALATPSAVAGTVFVTANSTASAGATVSTSIISTMSTFKSFLAATALITILCIPVGYHFAESGKATEAVTGLSATTPPSVPAAKETTFQESALFAEWRALHEKHGTNSGAMPLLHQAIAGLPDIFRRRAFHTALVSEWVQVDPKAGLAFYLEKGRDARQRRQFVSEWLALDARSAADALLLTPGSESMLREFLPEIARRTPEMVAQVASQLPQAESPYDRNVREAFAILAADSTDEARLVASKVAGPSRSEALAGIAQAWAKRDLEASLAWARGLPEGIDRDEVVRAALIGTAAVDPVAALDRLELAPPGGRHLYANSTTAAQVLSEAAKTDFDRTIAWIVEHPGRLGRGDVTALSGAVTEQLNMDTAGFLTRLSNEGSLGPLLPAIQSSLINVGKGKTEAVWDWLQSQPLNDATRELRRQVTRAAADSEPDLALKMVKNIPLNAAGDAEVRELAEWFFPGGYRLYRFDSLLKNAPERLRPALVETAFENLGSEVDDPKVWVDRLRLLPESSRAKGIAGVAHAWTMRSPEEAIGWVSTVPPGEGRNAGVAAVAKSWSRNDAHAAAGWVASIPEGAERDYAAESLVEEIAVRYPNEAWAWSLAIGDPVKRSTAAAHATRVMSQRDPATARQWLESGPFTPEQRVQLAAAIGAADLDATKK